MKRLTYLLVLATCVLNTAVYACPFCKDSVPGSDAQAAGSLPGGMNDSVYFMLGGFIFVLGLISTVIVRGVRDSDHTHKK